MTHVCDHRAVARWDVGKLHGQANVLAFLVALFCFGAFFLTAEAQAQNQNVRFWSGPGGSFDFYVLSLSWSPTFCALEGQGRGSAQCEAGHRIGFTVHGLWPQYSAGYPSNCPAGERAVPRATMDGIRDLFPDSGPARYQWRKHGSCSGADPDSCFRATRQAAGKVRISGSPEKYERTGINAGNRYRAGLLCRQSRTAFRYDACDVSQGRVAGSTRLFRQGHSWFCQLWKGRAG